MTQVTEEPETFTLEQARFDWACVWMEEGVSPALAKSKDQGLFIQVFCLPDPLFFFVLFSTLFLCPGPWSHSGLSDLSCFVFQGLCQLHQPVSCDGRWTTCCWRQASWKLKASKKCSLQWPDQRLRVCMTSFLGPWPGQISPGLLAHLCLRGTDGWLPQQSWPHHTKSLKLQPQTHWFKSSRRPHWSRGPLLIVPHPRRLLYPWKWYPYASTWVTPSRSTTARLGRCTKPIWAWSYHVFPVIILFSILPPSDDMASGCISLGLQTQPEECFAHMFIKKRIHIQKLVCKKKKEVILFIPLLIIKEIMLLILSINHGGLVSTNTVCQGFFFVADVTVFYLVHHLQDYIAQTLTDPLWGADLLDFPIKAAALRPNILWSTSTHPKIHHRDNINVVPIHGRNCLCLADLWWFK